MGANFTSYDGDCLTISGRGKSAAILSIINRHGNPVTPGEWWLRHVSGEQPAQDL